MTNSRAAKRVVRFYLFLLLAFVAIAFYSFLARGVPGIADSVPWLFSSDLRFLEVVVGGLALAGVVFTIYIGQTDLEQTLEDLGETKYLAHYADLDRLYFDLVAMAVDRPFLRTPALRNADNAHHYAVYAYMAWNFIETLADRLFKSEIEAIENELTAGPGRAVGSSGVRARLRTAWTSFWQNAWFHQEPAAPGGEYLRLTWAPTLSAEMELHRGWGEQADKRGYRKAFVEWSARQLAGEGATCTPAGPQAPEPLP